MELFDDDLPAPPGNSPEYTVSELSGAVKRVIEGEFGLVRVRGEVGRVSRPASGHLYFDLKDDRSVIAAISWKGQVAKMQVRPEEGMEVIATGRMTTFPGQSKYQLIVEDVAPAGAGALMAMLEKRRAALQAEGLFDAARKQPLPYLPRVIGVVTSPSGAVIRDILHRLRDRFPCHVLIWPVAVQGKDCAPQVAAAIHGFNAIAPGGPIPRPDVLIVARGGGSLEDLWGFNEEIVVRAAAASGIALISAVGHETDTTLIDHAADRRAPTPTAAAEMAVPVRLDVLAAVDALGGRLSRALAQGVALRGQRLRDLSRALPRLDTLLATPAQRLDTATGRLSGGLSLAVSRKRGLYERQAGRLSPVALSGLVLRRREVLARRGEALAARIARKRDLWHSSFDKWASRLAPSLARLITVSGGKLAEQRKSLAGLSTRLDTAPVKRLTDLARRLEALDRTRQTLGYAQTLRRGYAVVRGDGVVVTGKIAAEKASALEVEFHDGRLMLSGQSGRTQPRKGGGAKPPEQGSLF
ncbi:MAG: exodeoxyribonuclease VII large subunit [Paracoccaceae bacterium]